MRLNLEDFKNLKKPFKESIYLIDVVSIEELNSVKSLARNRGIVNKCRVLLPFDRQKDHFTIPERRKWMIQKKSKRN